MNAARNLKILVPDGGEVSALLQLPVNANCLLVLAHGAGAGMTHSFMEKIAAQLSLTGVATLRYQFSYMEQHRRVPDAPKLLTATVAAAVKAAGELTPGLPLFAGGKSMGGRMTSLAASEKLLDGIRGIVFFGFPLHPPKRPATKRAEHLKQIRVPMLFLQGTRDELADLHLLRPICDELGPQATLHVIDGADHSFHMLKRSGHTDAEVLAELAETAASWAKARTSENP
jgi:predicted alpha/beta-hydrolase family hydrolase